MGEINVFLLRDHDRVHFNCTTYVCTK